MLHSHLYYSRGLAPVPEIDIFKFPMLCTSSHVLAKANVVQGDTKYEISTCSFTSRNIKK